MSRGDNPLWEGNHELWRLIQKRVAARPSIPMAQIADEIGVNVDELCDWMMAYREPERPKVAPVPRKAGWSVHESQERYRAWQKACEGARQTLGNKNAELSTLSTDRPR